MGVRDLDRFVKFAPRPKTATLFGGVITLLMPLFILGYIGFLVWYNTFVVPPETVTETQLTAGKTFEAEITCQVEKCAVVSGFGPQPASAKCTELGANQVCRLLDFRETITVSSCYSDDPIDGLKLMAWDRVRGSTFARPANPDRDGFYWGEFFQASIRSGSSVVPLHKGTHTLNVATTLYNTDPWSPSKNSTSEIAFYPVFVGGGDTVLSLPTVCEGRQVESFGTDYGQYHLRLAPFYTKLEVRRPSIYVTMITQIGGFVSVLTGVATILVTMYQKVSGVASDDDTGKELDTFNVPGLTDADNRT